MLERLTQGLTVNKSGLRLSPLEPPALLLLFQSF